MLVILCYNPFMLVNQGINIQILLHGNKAAVYLTLMPIILFYKCFYYQSQICESVVSRLWVGCEHGGLRHDISWNDVDLEQSRVTALLSIKVWAEFRWSVTTDRQIILIYEMTLLKLLCGDILYYEVCYLCAIREQLIHEFVY